MLPFPRLASNGQLAFDALPSPVVVVDGRGRIVGTNCAWGQFAEANGATPEWWGIGCDYIGICGATARPIDGGASDATEAMANLIAGVVRQVEVEFPAYQPSERRWIAVHAGDYSVDGQPCRVLVHNDISDRVRAERSSSHFTSAMDRAIDSVAKRTEQALASQRQFLETLLEAVSNGILACDAEGNVTHFNRATREIFGAPLATMPVSEWGLRYRMQRADGTPMPPDEQPLARALRGETVRDLEVMVRRPSGRTVTLRISGDRITDPEGAAAGAVVVMSDITDQKRAEASLRELLLVDELTGLYNRRGFLTLAGQQLKVARRAQRRLQLVFVDMDDFKSINDRYGHQEGDSALATAAGILRTTFRDSDVIARLGGDEFVVLTVDAVEASPTLLVGRLLDQLHRHNLQSKRPYTLSFSVGTSEFDPAAPAALDQLMAQADEALYRTKERRKARQERIAHG